MSWLSGCFCNDKDYDSKKDMYFDEEDFFKVPEEPPYSSNLDSQLDGEYMSYSTRVNQSIRALPLCEGNLWYLNSDDSVTPVYLSIFVNGFTINDDSLAESAVFSPFSLVRNCKLVEPKNVVAKTLKMFKVSLFSQGVIHFFGVEDDNTRSRWVVNASHAIRTVTHSLFPSFTIRWNPIKDIPLTRSRILAGYLLLDDESGDSVTLLYAELHPPMFQRKEACLRFYKTESCQDHVHDIYFSDQMRATETPGINCSCFQVAGQTFSARTMAERKLWLRSISNLQVKMYNEAPAPDEEELFVYRRSIAHYVGELGDTISCSKVIEPLLERKRRWRSPFATNEGGGVVI